MVLRNDSYPTEIRANARNGEGTLTLHHIFSAEQIGNIGRMFARAELEPGSSIGYHVHRGEFEIIHILCGTAKINDNGETILLYPGDTLLTRNGEGHSVEVSGHSTLSYIAIVLHASEGVHSVPNAQEC